MVIPGGTGYPHPLSKSKWVPTSLMYILERTTEETFRFVVVNTDVQGGLSYHEASAAESVPTIGKPLELVRLREVVLKQPQGSGPKLSAR